MSFNRYLVMAALAASAPSALGRPLAAQAPAAPPGKTITFSDAIAIALKQNVAVRQAENSVSLSDATVKEQKMQLLPDLHLNVSGTENVAHGLTPSDPTGALSGAGGIANSQSMTGGLSTSLTVFDGGKTRSGIRSAEASDQASAQDLTRAKQTAVFTVASDYVALSNQQDQLRVQQENLTAQQAQEALIRKLVDGGTRPVSDLYQQQAAVANAKLAVAQANQAVELAKVDLIQTLQLDPGGTYDFVAPKLNLADTSKSYSLDSLLAQAYANRSDLKADASLVDAASQEMKGAAAGRLPTISVTGSYNSTYNSAGALGVASQLNQRQGGSIGIGVSIPIFDKGATSLAEQKAQVDADNARLMLANQRQTVALDVRRAYLNDVSAKQQLSAAEAQLSAATQAVDMTQKRYQAGAATLVEVTQARAQEVQAASAAATARNNLVLQEAMMSYYTGQLDPAHVSLGN